jgi:hypothetical protein
VSERQRQQWLRILRAEQHRRVGTGQAIDYRQKLIDKLNQMADRLRAAPDWVEPTPEEKEASRLKLNKWFEQNGYSLRI